MSSAKKPRRKDRRQTNDSAGALTLATQPQQRNRYRAARARQTKRDWLIFIAVTAALLVGGAYLFSRMSGTVENLRETTAPPPPTPPVAVSESPAERPFRAQFLQQLERYQNQMEPRMEAIHLPNWAPAKHAELLALKERAIARFADGEYLLAQQTLHRAETLAIAAVAEHAIELAAVKRAAQQAFARDQAEQTLAATQRALRLSPRDAAMRALQARAAVLPQVLDLLQQARVARAENRPTKEIAALQKIVHLDPARAPIQTQLGALQEQATRRRFAGALRAAQRALATGELTAAQTQIQLAQTMFRNDASLNLLQTRLQQAQAQREFQQQLARGEQARQRDNWAAAVKHFARAQQLQPNHKIAVQQYNQAQQVTAATEQIQQALVHPHRLSDENVLAAVDAELRALEPVIAHSSRLRSLHAELRWKVAQYRSEVEVMVVSDNATYIIVRGVGRVGKTLRRSISVRPGTRVFEGTRAGYQAKLVTLDIMPGASALEVTVICDEKI